jgi:formylglycine-generating enzyme required for sulfatase activity
MDQVSERITLAISLVAPPEFSMQVDDAVTIPAGTDTLGSPRGEPNRQSDEPQSDVTFDRSFAMMPTEVTQWQWSHLMGEDPNATRTRAWPNPGSEPCDTVGLGDDLPVTCVSWLDAIHYANAASIEAGLPQAYVIDGDAVTWLRESLGYRLPTEAEWEYAARAGGDGAWGVPEVDCERVQSRESCSTNSGLEPARSGAPNAWGLHHTVGNAWEWTWDWYGRYPSDRSGYAGPESGSARTLRGGSGLNGFHIMRVANRYEIQPDAQSEWVGLRLVRSLEVPQ